MNINLIYPLVYSFIVFKHMERKIHFRENWLIFWGICGEVELVLRIWGAKEKYFKGAEEFSSRIWGDQCIIFRDQGSTDPPGGGPHYTQL